MFKKLDETLEKFNEMGIPSWDILVMKDGEQVYRRYDGFSDYEKTVPLCGKERYNLYSCSKPITCTAALQLYEKGLFSLDDDLALYMPEFADMKVLNPDGSITKAKNRIKIKHLFTMTGGFDYNMDSSAVRAFKADTNGICPTRKFMEYLADLPLFFEPGTKYRYSLCHDVLAALVEEISGMRFADYVKKNIFDPLGMTHSTFNMPDNELDTICAQYRSNEEKGVIENVGKRIMWYKLGSEYESGGAGCISTTEDYVKFTEAMRKGDIILSTETIDLMASNHIAPEVDTSEMGLVSKGYTMGLGVRCPAPGRPDNTDFGWGGAATSYLAIDRKNAISFFFAEHVIGGPNFALSRGLHRIIKDCYGLE
ncbi:MAG: beta-lactamase family protein [Clostridia bacterium]|nr:beta-lactamase family protein [Clostridia bacterium]